MTLLTRTRTYTLKLTTQACCELEDRLDGEAFEVVARRATAQGRVTDLRWLLWAALQAYHGAEVRTPEDASTVIDQAGSLGHFVDVMVAFLRLNADDSPPSRESQKPGQKPPAKQEWRRLYLDARRIGLSADQFWSLSLRELWRELAADRDRQRDAHRRDVTLAWQIACLVWQKDLKPLAYYLGQGPRGPQSPAELKAVMEQLSAQTGTPLQRIPWPAKARES